MTVISCPFLSFYVEISDMFACEEQWHLWWLASPSITWWLLPFSGKDASCYCPKSWTFTFLNPQNRKYAHICRRGAPQRKLPRVISSRFMMSFRTAFLSSLPNPSVSEFLHAVHCYWIALESPALHCSSAVRFVLSAQLKNKQQLVGRTSKAFVVLKWRWREQGLFVWKG